MMRRCGRGRDLEIESERRKKDNWMAEVRGTKGGWLKDMEICS